MMQLSQSVKETGLSPVAVTGSSPSPRLKFSRSDRFIRELRRRVDAHFERTGRRRRDCPQMYFKTATILAWFLGAYCLLLFVTMSWWAVLPLAVVLGFCIAAIGFNIQHDGGHKAYSDHPWVNKIMALTLDLMGGSSYLWDWKHNTIHHTFPNIPGQDDDIDIGLLGRLSPHQRRFWFHRLQGIYLWLLYGLLDWYQMLPVDSGAVFYLERQAPDRYAITYGEETEPTMFISRNRVNELIDLGQRAEAEELPTFDILREIMEHYRKGIEYITLLPEVTISRRITRRMVASLLSDYHCFFQRGGSWVYDAKKLSQGFDRSKRKYLKK